MPKFKVIKEGINESLIASTRAKVEKYIQELFHDYEVAKVEDTYSCTFGTISVNIRVIGWHTEDVLVEVYAYVAENVNLTQEMAEELLRLNASVHFGSFGVTFDKAVVYSYSLAGANLDLNEFIAAVQTVATVADSYDEMFKPQPQTA
ncbi:MAG: YbjN domain-containing protein [Raineya sp.]|nr:YbjN domain-containing protein [Raineya sp.]MDW8295662.1 YbjN domain-containing protein [Raineya sp.]